MTLQEKLTKFYEGWDKTTLIIDAPKDAETRQVNFDYIGDIGLEGFKPGCNCQNFVMTIHGIKGSWNMTGGEENTYFEVFANDGEPREVIGASGEIVANPQKVKITLNLKASVPEIRG